MSTNHFTAGLVTLLIAVILAAPLTLLSPQNAYAQAPGVPTVGVGPLEIVTSKSSAWTSVKETLNLIETYVNTAANYAQYINTYILQPIAFVMSGELMKALTSSVIKFVTGKANATGIPQFVTDVRKSLQSISDFQKQAYLRQVALTNSPFATSIAQALGIDYNQKTSLAGFWAANMNTLGSGIPTYNNSYLAGNWSAGGIAAWFQLTTQSQNNPYLLYQNTQARLQTQIGPGSGGSTGARLSELSWGQGFMSWCGASDEATQTAASAKTAMDFCIAEGGTPATCDKIFTNYGGVAGGINPGDACTDKDGNPGTVRTPGSTIKATLDKVLGGQQDKLIQIGNMSSQVNRILGSIGTVLNTVNLAANILGGGSGGTSSGGLLGAGSPSGTLSNFDPSYGVTGSQIQQDANSSSVTTARNADTAAAVAETQGQISATSGSGAGSSGMPARVQSYTTYWNAIGAAASSTSATLRATMDTCHTYWNGSSTYEINAQNTLSFKVIPILTQAAGVKALMDAALAQDALVSSQASTTSTYSADLEKLNTMVPTANDVAAAEYNATAYGAAVANPAGSLTVSGSSIVDQMNLIRTNATAIQTTYCTTPPDYGGGGG